MLRQRIILFLIATVVLLGGALIIYGQRTGKLTIFGATPSSPAQVVVSNVTDLQKGIQAGDGNTELVNGIVQLKQGSQLSNWTKQTSANTPDFLVSLPGGDSRSYPQTTSFDEKTKKFFVSSFIRLYSYDPASKIWAQITGNFSGPWASWSNKLDRLLAIQGTGNIQTPSNIVSLDANGGSPQILGSNLGFRGENEEAIYHDPVSDMIVGVRMIDAYATGASTGPPQNANGVCSTTFETNGCVPSYQQVVEWFDANTNQYTKYDPSPFNGAWPEARVGASAAYDPIKKEILFFGGFTATPVFASPKPTLPFQGSGGLNTFTNYTFSPASVLWAFDTTTKTWSQRIGSNQPPGRAFSKITYDKVNKKFLIFGGLTGLVSNFVPADPNNGIPLRVNNSYTASNDLWSYDPATNAWQLLNVPNPPEGRFGHGIGYDSINKQLLVYSGQTSSNTSSQNGTNLPTKVIDTWSASAAGYAQTGTCQFDVGSPQIQQVFRYQSIKTKDLPANTSITVRFAGSTDGVSFGPYSNPVTYNASQAAQDSIDLSAILPANSHFVRVLCTMTSDGTVTPTFEGFTIDYQAVGTASPTFAVSPQLGQAPFTVTATRTDSLATVCTLNFGDTTADVSISGSQTLTHVYNAAGTFTATMTCDGQPSTQVVTVTSQPSAATTLTTSKSTYQTGESIGFTLTNLGPTAINLANTAPFVIKNPATDQVVFDPKASGSPTSLTTDGTQSWTWDQKSTGGNQAVPGSYTVVVSYTIGTTTGTVQSKSATFTISAPIPTPTGSVVFSLDPTDGTAPLTVTATRQDTTLTGCSWNFGDGTSAAQSDSVSVTHTYQTSGTFTATLTCGSQSGTHAIVVRPGTLAFTVVPQQGTAPLKVTASYLGTDSNLVWDFGDGTVQSVAQGPSTLDHTYQTAGAYTVTLRSGSASGSVTVLVSSGTTSSNTSTPILVNGSISGTTTPSSGVTVKPAALVSTGANTYVMGLLAAWLLASVTILTYQPKRHPR